MHSQRLTTRPSWSSATPALIVVMLVLFGGLTAIYHKKCPVPSVPASAALTSAATKSVSSAAATGLDTSNAAAKPGDTKTASLCDGTCYTAGSLNTTALATAKRYVSDALTNQYIDNYKAMGLQGDGMGSRDSSWATALLSSIQRAAGVYGAAGEIGVHHGYFWMSVALTARVGEKLFALDLFERNQDKNVDASGGGNMGIFKHNARTLGFPEQDIVIVEGMSSSITPGQLCSKIGYGFRFLSIDGGHTKEILLNDMKFAECCLQDGGIAALDDYSNAFWPGVHEGIVSYFDRHGAASRLAPFLLHANKLYVTTRSHHKRYLDAVTSQPFWRNACRSTVGGAGVCIEAPGVNGGNLWKFQLGGHALAVAEFREFDQAQALTLWKDVINKC